MPTYEERSRLIKALSEQSYFDALKDKEQNGDVRIGARIGDTGRYQVLGADGGVSSNGVKTFNASLPSDGYVRGIKGGNAIALDHQNVKRKKKNIVQDETKETGQLKTLYREGNSLYIGSDRSVPVEIYVITDAINIASITFRIDATGENEDDWIVTGFYAAVVSNITPSTRFKYVTITSSETLEEYASFIVSFYQGAVSGIWIMPNQSFKVGDEIYLASSVTVGLTQKAYVRLVTPVINSGITIGYSVGYSLTSSGSIITVASPVQMRLAKIIGSVLGGHGWFGDEFFSRVFNSFGTDKSGNLTLVSGRILAVNIGNMFNGQKAVFFKKTTSSVLPTPLIENKVYTVRNPFPSQLPDPTATTFDVYDGDTAVVLSGSFLNCYLVVSPISLYDYNLQSFTQNTSFYANRLLTGIEVNYDLFYDQTHAIPNTSRYYYINSASLGVTSGVYIVPDYVFLSQGKELSSQLVVKITVTKTADPLDDFINAEYRLYTGDTYIVIGTDYLGYPSDIYPEKQTRVFSVGDTLNQAFNNLIENRIVFSFTTETLESDGIAEISAYELAEGSASLNTISANFFAIPEASERLSTSVYI